MKEITRIHLAKVSYDIELDAKKDLQKYIAALERYAGDPEILDDIEIRMTELLAEHGVNADGVITKADVEAVRAQLGEPSDFAPEGDIAVGPEPREDQPKRKLFRDPDTAVLGGVLSGFAAYIGVDTVWVRLVFILLLVASFGTMLLVYLVLWVIVPPARSAAEKLQMTGQPVTLESIKSLGERTEPVVNNTAEVFAAILRYGTGAFLLFLAAVSLTATVAAGYAGIFGGEMFAGVSVLESWWMITALVLFVIAGLLFVTLCLILASALFSNWRWTKRIGSTVGIIIAAGILTFTAGVGVAMYGSWQEGVIANEMRTTTKKSLPAGFSVVKSLTVDSGSEGYPFANVTYTVSDQLRYEVESMPETNVKIELSEDGTSAKLRVDTSSQVRMMMGWQSQTTIRIYGPALDTVTVEKGNFHYENAGEQETLAVTGTDGTFSLTGSYKNVHVVSKNVAQIDVAGAAVESLVVDAQNGNVGAGVVRTLTVTQPDVCAAGYDSGNAGRVAVHAVSSGTFTYNGAEKPAQSIKAECGVVVFGDDEDRLEYGNE